MHSFRLEVVTWQAAAQLPNLESYLDNIAYELDSVEPALSADRDALTQQIAEIRVSQPRHAYVHFLHVYTGWVSEWVVS